ncbi:hypothetical protein [Sulfolobus monocaudavirus SMV4]|uniref:hypothetical protein n=1 Tax=Sulfolobus monocaudavirus SMV4 TaxID=1732178 RepID=UPI000706A26C|nr:hypothetical protein AVT99_gp28 [Sulfolobus monocaudavirus SMV4]ALG97052.1 hypothetical protein [Sulfolobus monocaudavirus SMV4]
MSQEFSQDQEGGESIFNSNRSLLKLDWDVIEKMIESFLNEHMRTWSEYDYFIIDDSTLLIKVYGENEPTLTIKARLSGDKLVAVEVS